MAVEVKNARAAAILKGECRMAFDGTKEELAERLEWEKNEVEKLGFALGLLTGDSNEVRTMVCRINGWIDNACEVLRERPQS